LCFAFSQITRTTPRRVITLHLTQIFLTDARTFIALLPFFAPNEPARNLYSSLQPSAFSPQFHCAAVSRFDQHVELKAEG
jgi:hypothetical protein